MFFGVSSSVTECFQSVTDYLQPVTDTKKHGRRSSRDDTATSLYRRMHTRATCKYIHFPVCISTVLAEVHVNGIKKGQTKKINVGWLTTT